MLFTNSQISNLLQEIMSSIDTKHQSSEPFIFTTKKGDTYQGSVFQMLTGRSNGRLIAKINVKGDVVRLAYPLGNPRRFEETIETMQRLQDLKEKAPKLAMAM